MYAVDRSIDLPARHQSAVRAGLIDKGGVVMASGTVRWFEPASGYGYVVPDGGGPDLYLHRVCIARDIRLTLMAGDRLEFETRTDGVGREAVNAFAPGPQQVEIAAMV
jgi:CspA family cold shock protein